MNKITMCIVLMCLGLFGCAEKTSDMSSVEDSSIQNNQEDVSVAPIPVVHEEKAIEQVASENGLDKKSTEALLYSSDGDNERCMEDVLPLVLKITQERIAGLNKEQLSELSASASKSLNEGSIEKEKALVSYFNNAIDDAMGTQPSAFDNDQFNQTYLLNALNKCLVLQEQLNELS